MDREVLEGDRSIDRSDVNFGESYCIIDIEMHVKIWQLWVVSECL